MLLPLRPFRVVDMFDFFQQCILMLRFVLGGGVAVRSAATATTTTGSVVVLLDFCT